MWHSEIRSLAPRILSYERAVLANAPPASRAADLVKHFLRSMLCSGSFMLFLLWGPSSKRLHGAPIMPEPTLRAISGETEDNWAVDIAVGWQTDQFKNGSIRQSERLAKYNRLLGNS